MGARVYGSRFRFSGWEAEIAARRGRVRAKDGGVPSLEGEEVVRVVGLGEKMEEVGDCCGVAAEDEESQLGEGGGGEWYVGDGGGIGGLQFGVGEVDDGFAFGGEGGVGRRRGGGI